MGKTDVVLFLSFVLEKWQQRRVLYLNLLLFRTASSSPRGGGAPVLGDLPRPALSWEGRLSRTTAGAPARAPGPVQNKAVH